MRTSTRIATFAAGSGLVLACTACSPEAAVYGSDGAAVRAVSNDVIEEVTTSGQSGRVCADAPVDFGDPTSWDGLSAGEPEKFDGEQWEEYADLSPTWFINVSQSRPDEGESAREVPAVLFFRGEADDLCIAGVAFGTRVTS